MFLIANLIYFLVQPLTIYNTLNNTLESHMNRQVYSELAGLKDIVSEEVAERNIPIEQYEALFNQKSTTYAKSFVFMMIPIMALLLYILFGRSRKYYVEHLVFSLNFYAFALLFVFSIYLFVSGWVYRAVSIWFLRDYIQNGTYGLMAGKLANIFAESSSQPIIMAYFYFATRRFFEESRVMCVLKSLLLAVALFYIIYLYRFLLFWLTFYSV